MALQQRGNVIRLWGSTVHGEQSSKELLRRWQAGDQQAAGQLYCRYAERLCALAQKQIGERLQRREDPEDAVQSAFRTFFRRAADGQFQIDHSGSLWSLLATITLNKARRRREFHQAKKRDVRTEVYGKDGHPPPEALVQRPTAVDVDVLLGELDFLLGELEQPEAEAVRLCLQGYSSPEIAAEVGCSRWTVRRVLDRIGHQLQRRLRENSGE